MGNFETLDDGTIRAKLSLDNHLRIIEALWEHHPRELYGEVTCPVLMMPARQRENPDAYERTLARSESIAAAERCCRAARRYGWRTASTTFPFSGPNWWPRPLGSTSSRDSLISEGTKIPSPGGRGLG